MWIKSAQDCVKANRKSSELKGFAPVCTRGCLDVLQPGHQMYWCFGGVSSSF